MKLKPHVVALLTGLLLIAFFTILLISTKINQFSYITLLGLTIAIGIAIVSWTRVVEIQIGRFKIILAETKEKISQLQEMYGTIENLKHEPYIANVEKLESIGFMTGSPANTDNVARWVMGVIKRERERLASIFSNEKTPDQLAQSLVDSQKDDLVFKYKGPETPLEKLPEPNKVLR